jgi:thymidylate kinase
MTDSRSISTTAGRHLGELVVAVFKRWRAEGISFLVLRNYENLPEDTTNDIDILVLPEQRAAAENCLVKTARAAGFQLHNRAEFSPVSLFFFHPESLQQIQFDLFASLTWRGFALMSAHAILERRSDRGLFSVPHPSHEALTCLLNRQIYRGYVKEDYKPAILAAVRQHPREVDAALCDMFGRTVAKQLTQAIESEDWPGVEAQTGPMRRQLVWRRVTRAPLDTLCSILNDLRRLLRRWLHPPGITIVLLGADGCGKSTVAAGLSEALRHTFAPDKSLRVHWKPTVFLKQRRAERPPTADPHALPPRGRLASLILLGYHWLEYLAGIVLQFHRVLFRNGLVLIDRYHYDFIVDPRRYRLQVSPSVVRAWFRFLPKPDLVFLLDAPPEVLRARKQEVPLDEVRRQREAFRALAAGLPNATIVDATQPSEAVVRAIIRQVLEYLEKRQAA